MLKEHGQVNSRGKAQPSKKVAAPQAWVTYGANQVGSLDITYLPSMIKGQFMRLYMVLNLFSRMIVGWEVHWEESAETL